MVASAGHLPFYRNGDEVPTPGTLPLGILRGIRYDSIVIQLAPGDRLTFVSDGVVEAQDEAGTLLGFDRTRELSRLSAAEIADTASRFGQVDDITVVTVECRKIVPAMRFDARLRVSGNEMKSGQTDRRDELFRQDAKLVQIVDTALADAEQRAGTHLACHPGCTQCCYGAFAISALDAFRLRNAMTELEATEPERAANITERARKYLAQYSSSFPGDRNTGTGAKSLPRCRRHSKAQLTKQPRPVLDPSTGLLRISTPLVP